MAVRRRAVLGGMLAGAAAMATTGCIADTYADTTGNHGTKTAQATNPKQGDQPDRITVVATGDVLLHERLWTTAKRDGKGGDWDFAPLMGSVKPLVQKADLSIAHLETPLAPAGGPYHGYPLFQGPPQIATALKQTGYDLCTTASNHSFDGGANGVDRTLNTLEKVGLKHAGTARSRAEAEQTTIVDVGGVKIASLSFTFGFNGLPYPNGQTWRAGTIDVKTIARKAQEAKDRGADLVLVSCHWGMEYSSKLNDQQREVAPQLLADSNIDLVIGHHAHVVQPMEQINGKWVAYGLGNLVAAHREPESTKAEGLLVRFTFKRDGDRWSTEQAEFAPLLMTDVLPVRVLDVRRELAKGTSVAKKSRLELAQRRTTETVLSLGAAPKML
ncbi:poly-gamma-glutamate synthesis protein (capsule biosynthesis protein) [Kribbella rubisoli]|uniref:Poly-gamma-glutamate synthesis protein (Capsule biosynthesis protein) n=1 Tax=Kribbella rubisoli TaxID=3075929 RepID=A0A4Q7X8E0_9ACTN|nr:CapA family protein [Kribbella rubisoli]RZU19402.1 poly-gamma-glutamate synthesis protein (capsule biosynthesis protein) [Kribbella rubisoli]